MRLEQLGWDDHFASAFDRIRQEHPQRALMPGRIVRQHAILTVAVGDRTLLARSAGKLEHDAGSTEELPVIGDWVALVAPQGEGQGRIHAVLPRKSALTRRAAGEHAEAQVIAANIDTVFVMAALDAELNFRRVERMLALTRSSGATPVVLLTKSDLNEDPDAAASMIRELSGGAEIIVLSAREGRGVDDVFRHLQPGRTSVLLGPSGVGKSTLANRVLGETRLATFDVREDDRKGRHTTTHRELFLLKNGALIVDGPGMREFGLWDADGAAAAAFEDIEALGRGCRFSDCLHEREPGCAVRAAAEEGTLDPKRLESYRKLRGEAAALPRGPDAASRRDTRVRSDKQRQQPKKKR